MSAQVRCQDMCAIGTSGVVKGGYGGVLPHILCLYVVPTHNPNGKSQEDTAAAKLPTPTQYLLLHLSQWAQRKLEEKPLTFV